MINEVKGLRTLLIKEVDQRSYQSDRKNSNVNIKQALEHMIRAIKQFNNKIIFDYEEEMEKMVVKVIDGETGKMIRQIPNEEIVRLSKNIDKLDGLLIDKKI
jgi:flagellar protein FlaG